MRSLRPRDTTLIRFAARPFLGIGRRLQDAHCVEREAGFVEHAEHRVAVDDQPRDAGHRARPQLLAPLAGHRGHEVAERLKRSRRPDWCGAACLTR
jgi:hypothetical protein